MAVLVTQQRERDVTSTVVREGISLQGILLIALSGTRKLVQERMSLGQE